MYRFNFAEWVQGFLNDLSYAIFGAFAGSVAYLVSVQSIAEYSWYKFSVGLLANGFASVLSAKVCDAMDVSEDWKIVAVGMAGTIGYVGTVKTIRKYLFNKFGVERRQDDK